MSAATIPTKPVTTESTQTEAAEVKTPTLETIVQAICLDARQDALKYILRSDTGHDGE
ncbi:MAG: hypothetical protein ACR2NZ_13465 [Rubripirellula sp.]